MNTYKKLIETAAVAVAIFALPMSASALRVTGTPMDMQQLTRSADEVVVGTVVEENAVIIGQRIETNYTIQVNESVKTRSGDLAPGRPLTITLPGGSLTTPPITQYVTGTPYMSKGEEVVLFLAQPKQRAVTRAIDPELEGNLRDSYRVVGYNQGRFSVVRDQESGERLVTRFNLSDFGLANTSRDTRKILDGIEQGKLPVVRRSILQESTVPTVSRDKDPLEVTIEDQANLTVEERKRMAETFRQQRANSNNRGLAVQEYDSFIQQVREQAAQDW